LNHVIDDRFAERIDPITAVYNHKAMVEQTNPFAKAIRDQVCRHIGHLSARDVELPPVSRELMPTIRQVDETFP
jgi:hypothetical protein